MNDAEFEAFRAAVEAKYRIHVEAFEAGEAAPIVEKFFWDDAVWECAGFPRRSGRSELAALFAEVVKTGHVTFRPIRSSVCGDMGWDFVDYPVRPRDCSAEPFMFRCTFVWLRRDGEWRVHCCVGFTVPFQA